MTSMSAPRGSASLDLQIDPNNDCEIFFNKFTRRSTSACVSESCSKITVEKKKRKRKLFGGNEGGGGEREREKEREGTRDEGKGRKGRREGRRGGRWGGRWGGRRRSVSEIVIVYNTGSHNHNNITNKKNKTYCSYSLWTCLDHNHHQFF